MRFARRPSPTRTRRTAAPRGTTRLGRLTTLELLERRAMLSGSPWQNVHNPVDVNNDLRVSPRDALIIINDLISNGGSRRLDGPAAAPLVASAAPGAGQYLDVNGDNKVSPSDLLMVINELVAGNVMAVTTYTTIVGGNPLVVGDRISAIEAGEQFELHVVVQDIRSPAISNPGVYSASADVSFNAGLSTVSGSVEFDSEFFLVHDSSVSSGRVLGYASRASAPTTGNAPQPMWSILMTATGSGTQQFAPAYDDDSSHEYNVVLFDEDLVPEDQIQFVGSILDVTGSALFIDDVSQPEDAGTPFNFTVSLSAPSDEIVTVRFATSNGSATTADNDYVATTGTLTFAAGETLMVVPVTVNPDTNTETDETFNVTLSNVTGPVNLGRAAAVGTILNEDFPPTLSVGDATVTAADTNTTANFTVTLTGIITQSVSVAFATANDTATAGVDYEANTGNLTFTPGGATTQVIQVTVLPTTGPKPDRTFFVNLSSISNPEVIIGDSSGVGTIVTQGISISDATVVEGNAGTVSAVFTVNLSRATVEDVTVVYQTANDTATAGQDYAATGGTLTFTQGGTQTQLITVLVNGDLDPEANERFAVNLTNAVGAPLFNSQGIGTILNDDGDKVAYRLEVRDSSNTPLASTDALDLNESFTLRVYVTDVQPVPAGVFQGFLDVAYEASLVMPVGNPVFGTTFSTITSFQFANGLLNDFGGNGNEVAPANPGAEFVLFTQSFKALQFGLVNFVASVDDADLNLGHETLVYLNDEPVSPDEINVENRSANIGRNVIAVSSETQPESNNLVFTFTRFLPDNTPATIVYNTANGTAEAGLDYVAKSGTLTFAAGPSAPQTITVLVTNDTIDEPDETMFVQLSAAVGAIAGTTGTGTIVDDDGEPSVSVAAASGAEGANVVFTVTLSSASGKTVTVGFNTSDGSAQGGLDYTPASGVLTFTPTVTTQFITVQALGDILLEPNENFQVTLTGPVNAALGTAQAQGTIIDIPPAGISGFVYVDLNDNGIKEPNETGIQGAIVTASRPSDGFTQSTVTGPDGSYLLTGLLPGVYNLTETQPGFYSDGQDRRFGVLSGINDRYSNIVLAPSAAETGYNFGEQGVRAEFIAAFANRRALFASAVVSGVFAPTLNMTGSVLNLRTGDIWVSFDGGWSGVRTIEALYDSSQGSVSMKLYNNALQEVAVSAPTADGSVIIYSGQTGQPYFLKLTGSNPNVTVEVSDPLLPLSSPSAGPQTASAPAASPPATTSSATSSAGRFASAADPMTVAVSEPLVGASDEALGEDEDWVLEAMLA